MKKVGSPGNANVLTIDIPLGWEDTKCPSGEKNCEGIIGPRFWARTGCRIDLAFDKAQCETGGCGGRYDCSAARLAASVGTTVSEWTFYEPWPPKTDPPKYFKDSPDISAVDGANLNMDIEPLNGDAHDPLDDDVAHDIQWLAEQYPLTKHGQDLRADADCDPANFRLTRKDLTTGKPYAFVEIDKNGEPIGGDGTVACLSNCGRYEFPTPPDKSCDEKTDAHCYYWKVFCLGDPGKYGQKCATDSDCQVGGACWDQHAPSPTDHTCQGRAFLKNPPCPASICTYPYGYKDTYRGMTTTFWSTQPPAADCNIANLYPFTPSVCIGDDNLHKVMPKVYTWPNDPQVYGGDASTYRVIFAPGGTKETITAASSIPFCDELSDDVYDVTTNTTNCGDPINYGALFAVAHPKGANWACDLDPTGAGDDGVICRWHSPSKIQQIGLRANFNSGGSSLQLNMIPGVSNGDLLLASITFFSGATPTAPNGWTPVPGASVVSNSNDQTVVWYHLVGAGAEPGSYTWTWDKGAFPSGGITGWRGVNTANPFDVTASVDNGLGNKAIAPSITTQTANAQLISVFGAGGADRQTFELPVNTTNATDETGALKVNGGPLSGTYYAHLVGDRSQTAAGTTSIQSVNIITNPANQPPGDWTAISIVLRP